MEQVVQQVATGGLIQEGFYGWHIPGGSAGGLIQEGFSRSECCGSILIRIKLDLIRSIGSIGYHFGFKLN